MQIIGHRGARKEAPENTLGGFKHIVNRSLRAVEFDVRLTADQQLVVIHDANTMRTVGVDLTVEKTNLAQLRQCSHTALWQGWQTAEPTPTLAEVLHICHHFNHIEVEVKAVASMAAALTLCSFLLTQLAEFETQATITSFDLKILEALQQFNAPFKRGLLIETLPQASTREQANESIISQAKRLGCSRIGMFDVLMTEAFLKQMTLQQLQCSVWTVNDPARARELATWGVQGLITDVPSLMLAENIGRI